MTALGKAVSLLLILLAASGSPAWCWPNHASQQDLSDPHTQLTGASGEGNLPVFINPRGTPIDATWLARRVPLAGMLTGQTAAASAIDAFRQALTDHTEFYQDISATASLVSLHSQLTV